MEQKTDRRPARGRVIQASLVCASLLMISPQGPALAEEEAPIVTFQSLSLNTALDAAEAALADCRERGFQVAVTVVDRFGVEQVTLRDRFAGPHTPDTSLKKAWTAVSFRTDTLDLAGLTESGEAWGIRNVKDAMPIGGGVQIISGDGAMLGAIGISGAPSGSDDQDCAIAGIAAIEDRIAF